MDKRLLLCIAICDKLPPEEAMELNRQASMDLTESQDNSLHHHAALLRLKRIRNALPKVSHPYYTETIEALDATIAYHQDPDYSPVTMIQAESTPRSVIPSTLQKAHGRPCWAAMHSAWTSIRHPHISQTYAASVHEFAAMLDFTHGQDEWMQEYRDAARDVIHFLNNE